jgi:hypothetical protein
VGAREQRDHESDRACPRGNEQSVPQQFAGRRAPWQCRADRHEEQQRKPDRHREPLEIRLTDCDLLVLQRLDEQRIGRAGQHHECEGREQQVVEQERGFTRER